MLEVVWYQYLGGIFMRTLFFGIVQDICRICPAWSRITCLCSVTLAYGRGENLPRQQLDEESYLKRAMRVWQDTAL